MCQKVIFRPLLSNAGMYLFSRVYKMLYMYISEIPYQPIFNLYINFFKSLFDFHVNAF